MQMGTIKNITHFALWYFNKACNYNCEYCFGHEKKEDKSVGRFSPGEIAKGFNDTEKSWWIGISGGEPFLYPKLTEIVKELTKKHFVHIDTNLSCSIDDFIENIEPGRVVYLNCAFHVAEVERRAKVDEFIKSVGRLKENGFSTIISYVTYPPVLDKLDKYVKLFKSYELVLQPKVFRGTFKKSLIRRRYPYAYTAKERELIEKYLIDPISRLALYNFPSYRGKLCSAGKNFIRIYPDGSVRRCTGDPTPLGNIFEGTLRLMDRSLPCRARFCKCLFLSRIGIIEDEPDRRIEFEKIIHLNDAL
jgi:MoaA/NifB/PqqE/SkfB family radical SAM enzyme